MERSRNKKLDFTFHIADQFFLKGMIQNPNSITGTKVYVDCDEDAYIFEREHLEKPDILTQFWREGNATLSQKELDRLLEQAPALFPILAIDMNGIPLMLAWGKSDSVRYAMESGNGTYFSRSRNKKWIKGEESGHLQNISSIYLSVDPYYIIYETDQIGAACHTGYYTCFFRRMVEADEAVVIYPNKVEESK